LNSPKQNGKRSASEEDFEGNYAEELTSESFKELRNLAFWAKNMGPEFYVVGGWACWRYHMGLGSRDIDIVFRDRMILETFLRVYYEKNGYEPYGGMLSRRYRKMVLAGDHQTFVEIDAAAMQDGQPFKENRRLNIPLSILDDHHTAWDLGGFSGQDSRARAAPAAKGEGTQRPRLGPRSRHYVPGRCFCPP